MYRYDDERASGAQRRAIRVAAEAAWRGYELTPQLMSQLRFNFLENPQGYDVQVWRVEEGKVNPLGNFTNVRLDRQFKLLRVTGGA
jgi:hypothetical protein